MTDNTHDHFDELLQDAARTYNRPPEEQDMPLGEMWDAIEAQAFPAARHAPRYAQWVRVAAALIVGVGIGRVSLSIGRHQPVPIGAASVFAQTKGGSSGTAETLAPPLDPATSRYLGQAAALLIELPAETNVGRPDQPFIKRANELLLTTRLLLAIGFRSHATQPARGPGARARTSRATGEGARSVATDGAGADPAGARSARRHTPAAHGRVRVCRGRLNDYSLSRPEHSRRKP